MKDSRSSFSRARQAACLGAILSLTAGPLVAQVDWKRIATTGPAHSLCGYAYDAKRDRLVVFGGTDGTNLSNGTWEFDGTTWRQMRVTGPSSRFRAAMVYDAARGVVLLFGGRTQRSWFNDTWAYDGTSWRRLRPTFSPLARATALSYDPVRKVVVMFGGFTSTGRDRNDLYEWNGTTWQFRSQTATPPLARGAHRMAWDPVGKVTLLYGGFATARGGTLGDTWAWNGTKWKQLTPSLSPGSLCDQSMCTDEARGRISLFGGLFVSTTSQFVRGDTFDFDGTTWVRRNPTSKPAARAEGHGVYDTKRNRVVMYGGRFNNQVQKDTWLLTPLKPASLTEFGKGCAGSNGTPKLTPEPGQLPWLGDRFDLNITGGATAATAGLLLFGTSDKKWGALTLPFDMAPFGAAGCPLNVSVDLLLDVIPLKQGAGVIPAFMCNCKALLGVPLHLQVMVIDPGVTRTLKVAATNAVRIVAGSR